MRGGGSARIRQIAIALNTKTVTEDHETLLTRKVLKREAF